MIARELDPKDYVKAHKACMDFYAGPEHQCSPRDPFPPLSEFTAPNSRVYVVIENKVIVAVAIMRRDRAAWYNSPPEKFVEAARTLGPLLLKDIGPFYGHVENPAARAMFKEALNAEGDGADLRFY